MAIVPHTASIRIGKRATFVPLLNKKIPTYYYNFAKYDELESRKRNHKLLKIISDVWKKLEPKKPNL
ncbi:hypothetical protein L1987_29860 [Smallanthus sonchifolius]|uniref:Uncharacterized protein n=1 Tax=Smallanthus sonchifolius TaxID=185202 RepID=A0ACB9I2R0_9ASTR|nr:hypothetical protein L1987_29860 [Smallanthus sonchifolius]